MDGTGNLFYPLLKELPLSFDVKVITFSNKMEQNYDQLFDEIKQQLPRTPFILVAESFSGGLAYRISLDSEIPLQKLILIATFLESPRPILLRVARLLPLSLILSIALPAFCYKVFCFGNQQDSNLVGVLKDSLKQVGGAVLSNRLGHISKLKLSNENVKLKTLIINPLSDRLIPKRISSRIQSRFPNSVLKEIDGPHFLAQVCAKDVAASIQNFIQTS